MSPPSPCWPCWRWTARRTAQDAPTRALLTQLGDGLAQYQLGDGLNYPWGMHPDSAAAPFSWHAWGSTQASPWPAPGKQLGQRRLDRLGAQGSGPVLHPPGGRAHGSPSGACCPCAYPQIAYGVEQPHAGLPGAVRGDRRRGYAQRAGLAAGWFFGNNAAGAPMYDPATGRGYDGLQGANEQRINRNAGAESTIESADGRCWP